MADAGVEALVSRVADQGSLDRKIETLVLGLAERMKATSNDQNVQKLARELRALAPQLIGAIVAKTDA